MSKAKSPWLKYLVLAAVVVAAYFINVAVQTRLGEKALAETGLPHHSLDEAFAIAAATDKKVLAALSAIWCPTCRRLDKKIFSHPEVQSRIAQSYVFARIEFESEEGQAFKERYDVRSFPTLLVLDAQGSKRDELPVTFYPDEFISFL